MLNVVLLNVELVLLNVECGAGFGIEQMLVDTSCLNPHHVLHLTSFNPHHVLHPTSFNPHLVLHLTSFTHTTSFT